MCQLPTFQKREIILETEKLQGTYSTSTAPEENPDIMISDRSLFGKFSNTYRNSDFISTPTTLICKKGFLDISLNSLPSTSLFSCLALYEYGELIISFLLAVDLYLSKDFSPQLPTSFNVFPGVHSFYVSFKDSQFS